MRATEFEFRHRFYFFVAIYWIGFACYSIDHRNMASWLSGATDAPARRILFAFAALLAVLAAALRTWAAAYLNSDVVHDTKLHSERLVADGPYRHLRNPLYLGGWLLTVGVGFLASRLGFAVLVGAVTLFNLRLIRREEAVFGPAQGQAFLDFKKAVPSVIPSLGPRVPASGRAPRWGQAFRGEAFMWGFALAMTVYAITLRGRITYWLFFVSLAGYLIFNMLGKRIGAARVK